MSAIMQGTTPAITITIDSDDFLLSDVTAIELYIQNKTTISTYTLDELVIDTTNNTITKTFTEAETAAMLPKYTTIVQGRFWMNDGNIFGINKLKFATADMIGVGCDG